MNDPPWNRVHSKATGMIHLNLFDINLSDVKKPEFLEIFEVGKDRDLICDFWAVASLALDGYLMNMGDVEVKLEMNIDDERRPVLKKFVGYFYSEVDGRIPVVTGGFFSD